MGLFLKKNNILRCYESLSLLHWIGALTFASIAKTASKKIGTLILCIRFFSPVVALFFSNLPYSIGWNTFAVSGLVLVDM